MASGKISEDQNYGYISAFELKLSGQLQTHIFENADVDWLHCIAAHRKKKLFIEVEDKLKKQYCFKTEAAINCLKFVEGTKIWLK